MDKYFVFSRIENWMVLIRLILKLHAKHQAAKAFSFSLKSCTVVNDKEQRATTEAAARATHFTPSVLANIRRVWCTTRISTFISLQLSFAHIYAFDTDAYAGNSVHMTLRDFPMKLQQIFESPDVISFQLLWLYDCIKGAHWKNIRLYLEHCFDSIL